jgi:hypothetical protein
MVLGMDAVFASGVNAFQNARARLQAAVSPVERVRVSTIPAASPQDASQPRAAAGPSPAPPPPADPGGRAPSSPDFVDASVEMIRAGQEARLGDALIRTGEEMTRTILDIRA